MFCKVKREYEFYVGYICIWFIQRPRTKGVLSNGTIVKGFRKSQKTVMITTFYYSSFALTFISVNLIKIQANVHSLAIQ